MMYLPQNKTRAIVRNETWQNRLYEKIAAHVHESHVTTTYVYGPAIRPEGNAPFEVFYKPQAHKLTARKPLIERIVLADEYVSECEVSLVYQRKYDFNKVEVYCDGCRVVGLRAAYGQPLRKPQRFAAVVANCNGKAFSTVYFEAGQMLRVVI